MPKIKHGIQTLPTFTRSWHCAHKAKSSIVIDTETWCLLLGLISHFSTRSGQSSLFLRIIDDDDDESRKINYTLTVIYIFYFNVHSASSSSSFMHHANLRDDPAFCDLLYFIQAVSIMKT